MSGNSGRTTALLRRAPREAVNIAGTALGVFFTVAMGSALSSALPAEQPAPWLFAGCYLAPAAAAFAAYWYAAQRL